jgi:hypothetical protein
VAEPNDQLVVVDIAGVNVITGVARQAGRLGRLTRDAGGFDDRLVSLVVRELVMQLGLPYARERRRLFAGDGVRPLAEQGEAVWGPGVPLLVGGLRPELVVPPESRSGVAISSELTLPATRSRRRDVVEPGASLEKVLRRLAASVLVVTSSPTLVAVSEALGVPTCAVRPADDSDAHQSAGIREYYEATGRDPAEVVATDPDDALERGGAPSPAWDPHLLLDAFPAVLWGEEADPTILAAIGWRARLAMSAIDDAVRGRDPGASGRAR